MCVWGGGNEFSFEFAYKGGNYYGKIEKEREGDRERERGEKYGVGNESRENG